MTVAPILIYALADDGLGNNPSNRKQYLRTLISGVIVSGGI